MKIAFVGNWGASPSDLYKWMCRMTPGCSGSWHSLRGTPNPKEADYIVVLEDLPKAMKASKIGMDRIIYSKREPSAISPMKKKFKKSFLCFDFDAYWMLCFWFLDMTYDDLKRLGPPKKSKPLSCILSGKRITRGQKLRVRFANLLAKRMGSSLDVFGRDLAGKIPSKSFRGSLPSKPQDKTLGLRDYSYSFAAENSRQKNYFSEKLSDCLLMWSMPIYWGCPNLKRFFPPCSCCEVDISDEAEVDRVVSMVQKPLSGSQLDIIEEARNRILDQYSLWPSIYNQMLKRGVLSS